MPIKEFLVCWAIISQFCCLSGGENRRKMSMDIDIEDKEWEALSHEQKNHQLYLRQKALLDQFLEKGAISQEQHDKSLHDLTEKMHEAE